MNGIQDFFSYLSQTYCFTLIIGLICSVFAFINYKQKPASNTYALFLVLAIFLIIRIGCQPVGFGTGGDRENYAMQYIYCDEYTNSPDWFLGGINRLLHPYFELDVYFIIMAILYVSLYSCAILRLAKKNSFWLLVATALSFGFLAYGYNTMRAGLAIGMILLGFSYYKNLKLMAVFLFLGVGTHFSMIIPVIAFIISKYYNKPKIYYTLWFISIPLSFIGGGFFNTLFAGMSDDQRTSYLTTTVTSYNVGFRIDFIIYSLIPMAIGAYYIFKLKFQDKLYINLYNTYILSNIFWILVIRANFSDRFAYLSWFIIPFILVYPLLSNNAPVKQPNQWLALVLLGETAFMYII